MSMSTFLASGLLDLILNNVDLTTIGDAGGLRGSATAGSLYIALHTADVAVGASQDTNEVNYTDYVRKAVARTGTPFSGSGDTRANAALQEFVQAGVGSPSMLATHWSIGRAASGATTVLFAGPLAGAPKAFTATTADTLTVPGHTLIVGDRAVAYEAPGAVLPTGLTRGVVVYVKTVSGNDITLSATSGGATLDITAAGAGVVQRLTPLSIGEGVKPTIAIGAMTVKLG